MSDEPFLLVSLEDEQAKKLAQVLSNKSATSILAYLSREKDATESALAKRLKLPLSTIHYNMQQLVQAGLVIADTYHYSEKGREVLHYRLTNKYVIIAPKAEKQSLTTRLRDLLPATLIAVATAGLLKVLSLLTTKRAVQVMSLPKEEAIVAESVATSTGVIQSLSHAVITNQVIIAFLIGAFFALAVVACLRIHSQRRSEKKK